MNLLTAYFRLQVTLVKRQLSDFGINPIFALILFPTLLVSASFALYARSSYAGFIFAFMALTWILKLSNSDRFNFLKLQFKKNDFLKIRTIENLSVALPFIVILVFNFDWLPMLGLLALSLSLVFYKQKDLLSFALPTPFGKSPFEFIIGLRAFFLVYPIALSLMLIAYQVENPNLGLVAFGVSCLLSIAFYQRPEPTYWVWNHATSANTFLWQTVKRALKHYFITNLILAILAIALFPTYWYFGLLILCSSAVLLAINVIAKYSSFPNQLSIVDSVYLGISMFIPIFLPIAFYYFTKKSIKQLAHLL
jgi:hypothetical protein